MLKVEQRKLRNFNQFQTIEDVLRLLKEQFSTRKLYIKYDVDKREVMINEYNPDNTLMVVTDPNYKHSGDIIIYGLSDKYIEIDLEVLDQIGPGYYKCRIKSARRATEGRRDLRFKINPGEAVATNFRVSKHTIELTRFNIPTSIKVVIEQFQSVNSKFADIFRVDVFSLENKDIALKHIKNTGKTLFIEDTTNPESYKSMTEDFVDIAALYGNDLDKLIKRNIEKGFKSIIIVPVIYITEDEKSINFAYIQAISKTDTLGLDKVIEMKEMSFKLVDRIRDANTILVSVHQPIIDVSRGGAKLKITDPDLKKYIQKSKGFIFDIVFKLQAPLTIYGEIKSITFDPNGDMYIGVDFEGNSSRKDEMKRFYDVLKPMEIEYKSKLMKSMKNKK
ncbi:MAG: hypothetical protein BWY23_00836 [Spirochaetes bacterium ADurb.Bin218]|nr:DUF1577 domain-containing protein [Spirochaetota bacterium]OQA98905.1 MAG: hypothetical protein BWY23_00836 [Spirochaetes bacterium ADurb.Bin218]